MAMILSWVGSRICKIHTNHYKAENERFAEELFGFAMAAEEAGDNDSAVEIYEHVTRFAPLNAGPWINRGGIYLRAGNLVDAEIQFRRALELAPDYPLAHFNLANLFDERKMQSDAIFHYQKAIECDPHYADAHYNLAIIYEACGEKEKAVTHYNLCLAHQKPGDEKLARTAEAEVKRLNEELSNKNEQHRADANP